MVVIVTDVCTSKHILPTLEYLINTIKPPCAHILGAGKYKENACSVRLQKMAFRQLGHRLHWHLQQSSKTQFGASPDNSAQHYITVCRQIVWHDD